MNLPLVDIVADVKPILPIKHAKVEPVVKPTTEVGLALAGE
jgi:hypothetical protein